MFYVIISPSIVSWQFVIAAASETEAIEKLENYMGISRDEFGNIQIFECDASSCSGDSRRDSRKDYDYGKLVSTKYQTVDEASNLSSLDIKYKYGFRELSLIF